MGAGQQVHQLRPAAEQMRHVGTAERVAVVLDVGAQVVRIAAVQAVRAPSTRDIGGGHDSVTHGQGQAHLVEGRWPVSDCLDHTHVLVAADERVGGVALVHGPRVLLALASPRVLVRAADARILHSQQDRPRLWVGPREAFHREPPRRVDDRSSDGVAHLTAPMVSPRTKCRCTISANRMIGNAPITPAAAIGPHSIWILPIRVETPTGTVCAFGVEVSESAIRKSLYVVITLKIAVAAIPGAASGSTTRRKAVSRESPSTIAASSMSRGISSRKLCIIQMTKLVFSPV